MAKETSSAVKQFPISAVKQFPIPGLVDALETPAISTTRTLEELLDVNRAAKVLGIRPKTLRHHVLRRRIDYVKIGGRVLFRPDTLWEFIERNTIRARQ